MDWFLQQLINGLALGSIYALIALGYTMVYGVLRFINFAHSDVLMLGAFAAYFLAPAVGKVLPPQSLISAVVVTLLAAGLCAGLGILIELLAYRPLRNRPKLTVLITAIGVSLFLESFGQYIFGANPQAFPTLIEDVAIDLPPSWGSLTALTVTTGQVIVLGTTLVLMLALTIIVLKTKIGMAMRALAYNPTACSLMGVNNNFVISFTFGLGSEIGRAHV